MYNKLTKLLSIAVISLFIGGCSSQSSNDHKEYKFEPLPDIEKELSVESEKVECQGIMAKQQCYKTNEGLFYDYIHGFDFESGYEYKLKIKRSLAYDLSKPSLIPQDVSIYRYDLVEILDKKKAL